MAEWFESWEEDTPFEWPLYEDYAINDNDVLVPRGKRIGSYSPFLRTELPTEIYKLRERDNKSLLDFARRYGTFGFYGARRAADIYEPLSKVDMMQIPEEAGPTDEADPLYWIWAHVHGVQLILDAVALLREKDEDGARRFLRRLQPSSSVGKTTDPKFGRLAAMVGKLDTWEVLEVHYPLDAHPLLPVAKVAHELLQKNLRGIIRQPRFNPKTYQLESRFCCLSMIQAAYWHLINMAEGGNLLLCAACQTPFLQTDKRQRFCPPRYMEKESRCAGRARQQKLRAKGSKEEGNGDA